MILKPRKTFSGKSALTKPDLQIDLGPSLAYSQVTLLAHGLCLLVIALSPIPVAAILLLSVLLCGSGYYCYCAAHQQTQLKWRPNDTLVWLSGISNDIAVKQVSGRLCTGSYQCHAFIVLCMVVETTSGSTTRRSLLIPRDAVSVADFRTLRSRLTIHNASHLHR